MTTVIIIIIIIIILRYIFWILCFKEYNEIFWILFWDLHSLQFIIN
jgi:hypothetical protein